MSELVTPGIPTSGLGADKYPTQYRPARQSRQVSASPASPPASPRANTAAGPLPGDTPETLMSDALFATSVLAERMRRFEQAIQRLRSKSQPRWSPPQSSLRLKDTSV